MDFTNARFADETHRAITVELDGRTLSVPVDPENRHYAALIASGITITDHVPPGPTAADVRAEASRRMQVAFGARDAGHLEIIVSNATREVARLNQIKVGVPDPAGGWFVDPREWTNEEKARLVELHFADTLLEAIRAASNVLEAMDPVPPDFATDDNWPPLPGA